MFSKIQAILLLIVGLINLAPIMVFFSPSQTKKLYGLTLENDTLLVLMRHRAVLLGLVGMALFYAVIKPEFRMAAIAAAFISKIAFFFLIMTTPDYASELKQVALIDAVALVLLCVVLVIQLNGK